MSAQTKRTKAQRDDDRITILAALTDAGRPLRIDELLRDAWNVTQDFLHESRMRTDLDALERVSKIRAEWPTPSSPFVTYRLTTPEDLDEAEDLRDLARLMSNWEEA